MTNESSGGFYFALPRLLAGAPERSEKNALETHLAGALTHLVIYACAFRLCLTSLPWWGQLLGALPLAAGVWLFWLLLFYGNALLLRLPVARALGGQLPRARRQSILVGALTVLAAIILARGDGWLRGLGLFWLALVALNLGAAALLALAPQFIRRKA